MQAKNLCILAKFGNKFKALPEFPTSNCAGRTQRGIPPQVLDTQTYTHARARAHTHKLVYIVSSRPFPSSLRRIAGGGHTQKGIVPQVLCVYLAAGVVSFM